MAAGAPHFGRSDTAGLTSHCMNKRRKQLPFILPSKTYNGDRYILFNGKKFAGQSRVKSLIEIQEDPLRIIDTDHMHTVLAYKPEVHLNHNLTFVIFLIKAE